ncbi:MAG: hypothetical protein OEY93_07370 [Anaerolineae bacterium]|nr:hypothetical protein [Anaerolineae bacterium]
MKINPETLKKVLFKVAQTRPDEISCDTCYQELDRFAEMLNAGEKAETILPLVQHHLEMCANCDEEFKALVASLEGTANLD